MNICAKKIYEVNGEEKITWYKVGVLKISDNSRMYVRLFMHPSTEFSVFESKTERQD